MMTKWDTIQEDIKDAYAHLDDVDEVEQEDIGVEQGLHRSFDQLKLKQILLL